MNARVLLAASRVWESARDAAIQLAALTGRRHRVKRVGDVWVVTEVGA